jgi:CMP-2-keto-3-deoxyoctulosonic acid synthetase
MSKPPEKLNAKVLRFLGRATRADGKPVKMPDNDLNKRKLEVLCAVVGQAICEEHDSASDIIAIVVDMMQTAKKAQAINVDGDFMVISEALWRKTEKALDQFIAKKQGELEAME